MSTPDGLPTDLQDRISAGRVLATRAEPYLGSALHALRTRVSPQVQTLAADRWWQMYINPETTSSWTPEQWATELRAQVRRLLFEHAERAEKFGLAEPEQLRRWQAASDSTVRSETHRAGHDSWPQPGVLVEDLPGGRVGMPVEEVYELLRLQNFEGVEPQGSSAHGVRQPWEQPAGYNELEPPDAKMVRYRCAQEAITAQRDHRPVAPDLAQWATNFGRPAVDWRRTLEAAVSRMLAHYAGARDWSYSRPRRYGSSGSLILPGMVAPAQPHVVVVRDTSPSMTFERDLLRTVTAEVSGLLDEKARVTLIDTSSEAATARRVTSRQQLAQVQRGEGTDMGAGLEAAGRARPRPHLVVVLTDGDTDWPERKPVHGAGVVVVLFGSRAQQLAAQVPHWASTLVVDKLV